MDATEIAPLGNLPKDESRFEIAGVHGLHVYGFGLSACPTPLRAKELLAEEPCLDFGLISGSLELGPRISHFQG
jgi:hypothetical protein